MIKKALIAVSRVALYAGVLITVFCGFGLFVSYNSASADASSLMAKWQNAMYYDCQSRFATSVEAGGDNSKVINSVLSGNIGVEYLPSYNYSGQGASLSCTNVVENKVSGLSSATWKDIANAENILKSMGYTVVNGDRNFTINASVTTEECVYYYYDEQRNNCSTWTRETESATIMARYNSNDGLYYYQLLHPWVGNAFKDIKISFSNHNMIISDGFNSHSEPLVNDPSEFLNNLRNSLANVVWDAGTSTEYYGDTGRADRHSWYNFSFSNLDQSGASKYYFSKADSYAAANKLSSPSLNDSELTATERYNLYMYYLSHAITAANNGFVSNPDNKTGLTEVKYRKSDGSSGVCYANLNGAKSDTLYTLNMAGTGSNRYPRITTISLSGIIQWLNNVDISKVGSDAVVYCDEVTPTTTPDPGTGSTGGGSGTVVSSDNLSCDDIQISDGKIGAMQWILCPAMDNTRYTASWIDEKVDEWLSADASVYSNDAVKGVWEMMRNIANVLMIVFLSIVIFSQLTGYGIDNYGIKKMLPRLIVMAIVINLSLYICQIAADLSNILGLGLRNMFASFGGEAAGLSGGDYLAGSMLGVFSAAAGGGAAGISAGFTTFTLLGSVAVALIVVFIVIFIVVLVALLVFSIMLGARQIIIIVCIILAPLAFAAFILPNTQNLFKKWWDLYKAALIIYPICGAVSGISYLLRSMNSGGSLNLGVGGGIVMIILPYLVFFLLPTMLKNAISALGKVGGALTSLGNTVRNGGRTIGQGAMRAGQNSQRYKDLQQETARRQQEQRANRIMNRFGDGGDIRSRIEDAQRRINSTQDGTREHQRAVRDLQRAQADQRRFYEAQQTHYQLEGEQAVAETSPEVLATRAVARQEALELKNYEDQYRSYSRSGVATELTNAITAYNGDRSDSNRVRLQAAYAEAERRGMDKEMLGASGLTGLKLATNAAAYGNDAKSRAAAANDMKLLNTLSGSNNVVVSQFGKQMGKYDGQVDDNGNPIVKSMDMNSFVKGADADISLGKALAGKGQSSLNGTNDDILGYIGSTNKAAVSTQMLVNAAMNTSNEKELTEINNILKSRVPLTSTDYELKPAELAKLNIDTVNSMNSLVYRNAVQELLNTRDTDASRQIINSMDQKVREKFGLTSTPLQNGNGGQDFNDGGGI